MPRLMLPSVVTLVVWCTPALAQFKESKEGCSYQVKELEAALGFPVEEGKGTESTFPGGRQLSCRYAGKARHGVTVTQVKLAAPGAFERGSGHAGSREPITGDPDRAWWQVGQGDLTDVSLTYVRASTEVQVRVTGVDPKAARDVQAMRERVLRLRRLPSP